MQVSLDQVIGSEEVFLTCDIVLQVNDELWKAFCAFDLSVSCWLFFLPPSVGDKERERVEVRPKGIRGNLEEQKGSGQ